MASPKPAKAVFLGRPGNDVKMGIVGMPNIGKSTLFNALSGLAVPAENYPFCTIEPSVARVRVPDKRFDFLCASFAPRRAVPAALTITDIAGLVRGASQNRGLGNEFLSHIYGVDGVFHLVRAFAGSSVEHVEGEVDPVRDMAIVSAELRAKDAEVVRKRVAAVERAVRSSSGQGVRDELDCLQRLLGLLEQGRPLLGAPWSGKDVEAINSLYLITAKPVVFLVNVSSSNWKTGKNKWLKRIKDWVDENQPGASVIPFCAEFEKSLAEMGSAEAKAFLHDTKQRSQIGRITRSGYSALSLLHFFTCGQDEVKCWTIRAGTKVRKAAAVIHTDFEKFFICAAVMAYDDYKECGSEQAVKLKGKHCAQGKDYLVRDGDIVHFKHNAGGAKKK